MKDDPELWRRAVEQTEAEEHSRDQEMRRIREKRRRESGLLFKLTRIFMGKESNAAPVPLMQRRTLRFESIEELMADVDCLEEAQRARRIRPLGNWDFGKTLNHLATWAEFAFAPCPISAPFFVRWFFRLQKRKLLSQPMRTGAKIPRVPGGTLGTEPADWEQSLPRFRRAMERMAAEPPTQPSVIFGKMSQRECVDLNLRHAELHLSFLAIEDK